MVDSASSRQGSAESRHPYVGDRNVIGGATVGAWGCAFIALALAPWVALIIVLSWGMGLIVGLHVQAIREAQLRRENVDE